MIALPRRRGLIVPRRFQRGFIGRALPGIIVPPATVGGGGGGGGGVAYPVTLDANVKTSGATLSGGNLTVSESTSSNESVFAQGTWKSGKYYFEVLLGTNGSGVDAYVGFRDVLEPVSTAPGSGLTDLLIRTSGTFHLGTSTTASSSSTGVSSYSAGDVMMVAIDFAARKVWFGKNGSWFNSGDPATGTNAQITTIPQITYAVAWCSGASASQNTATFNFGASSFAYTVPSGYTAGVGYVDDPALHDRDFSLVQLLTHLDGANGATSATDASTVGRTVSQAATATLTTATKKFGTASIDFTGGGRWSVSGSMALGTEDFTVEGWVYRPTGAPSVASYMGNQGGSNSWILVVGFPTANTIGIIDGGGSAISTDTSTLPTNQFVHFAWGRNNSRHRLWINGQVRATGNQTAKDWSDTTAFTLGAQSSGGTNPCGGYIDELRVTRGICRYHGDFTAPAAAFVDVA
jgi:hypothetical protein